MALACTSKETPERQASYSQTRSVYSSISMCTYEHGLCIASLSSSTSKFGSEITSSQV